MQTPFSANALLERCADPRSSNRMYALRDVLILVTLGLWAGCDGFVAIAHFGRLRQQALREHLGIARIPSHDTLRRVMGLIDPTHFEGLFRQLMMQELNLAPSDSPKHLALDGKCLTKSELHTVSVFCSDLGLSLAGQDTGFGKGSELPTMVKLVQSLKVQGCVITADAMGCNESLMAAVRGQKADYVLQLKGNQSNALDSVTTFFATCPRTDYSDEPTKERSGVVARAYTVHSNLKGFPFLEFTGLRSIARCRKTITAPDGTATQEDRFYLASLTDPAQIAKAIRGHWAVENGLHWRLDVQFGEDASRVQAKTTQKNLSVLRKIVLNTMKLRGVKVYSHFQLELMVCAKRFVQELKALIA